MALLKTYPNACRACLRESLDSYFDLSKQCYFATGKNFGEIFHFCTRLNVEIHDEFPKRICILCVQDLQKTYLFLQKVLINNKKWIDMKAYLDKNNDILTDNDYYVKDPLENATDNEDAIDNESISENIEQNDEGGGYFPISFDNLEDSQANGTLLSDSDNEDFFKSVESQIFPKGRFKCKICCMTYFTNVGLQTHMDIHTSKKKAISKTSRNGEKHVKRKIKFDIPDDENSNNQNINSTTNDGGQTKQVKPKKIFPCNVCGKQMISASKLRYHMVMHTGEKDYLCTMCPKAYSTIYALKHHMRAHTGERPYECKFCGDRFLRPTTLKSHMRRHTGERPYGCDICGKRFIQHSSMATHMKLNHMDRTINCPYCAKKYARQTDLNTHLLSHSGDKPFGCKICSSRFTRQSNLNKHMNQHHSNSHLGDRKCNKIVKEDISDKPH